MLGHNILFGLKTVNIYSVVKSVKKILLGLSICISHAYK